LQANAYAIDSSLTSAGSVTLTANNFSDIEAAW
jgi:hypothetical protein